MKTDVDQDCIDVTDPDRRVHSCEAVVGSKITHRVETPAVSGPGAG